jgi:hypothetical protein
VQETQNNWRIIMSAYLVNKNHIAELVKSYYRLEDYHRTWINCSTGEKVQIDANKFEEEKLAIAFFLAWANIESLIERYGKESEMTNFNSSRYCADVVLATKDNKDANLSLAELIKMCDCLAYQSCDVDGYNNSDQYFMLERIKDCFVRKLVDQSLNEDDVQWEYVA